jgi:FkbM family methyltransferase
MFFFVFRNLRPKKNVVIKVQGSKMYINPRDMIGGKLWGIGSWETTETALLKKMVKEGMVFADIGANIGYYSLLVSQLVGKEGKIYAFEPAPENYSTLLKNIEMNGYQNIITVNKAVSNTNGIVRFFIDESNPLYHKLKNSKDIKGTIEVNATTLDDYFKDKERKIDIIKMDVEGAELAVLKGMRRVMTENKNLIILAEFSPENLRLFGANPDDFLHELVENGFKIYEIDMKEEVLHDVDIASFVKTIDSKGIGQLADILCKRETRH